MQDIRHTWDAAGNLTQRQNLVSSETENFAYDFLDRLTGVSGAYTQSYTYNTIGNITSMNGNSYTYGTKPHAVTQVGTTGYTYDANGNMTTRGSQTIVWDAENRVISVISGQTLIAEFNYDGDGNRVKKTESGQTVLYINQYYEKVNHSMAWGETEQGFGSYYLTNMEILFILEYESGMININE